MAAAVFIYLLGPRLMMARWSDVPRHSASMYVFLVQYDLHWRLGAAEVRQRSRREEAVPVCRHPPPTIYLSAYIVSKVPRGPPVANIYSQNARRKKTTD